MSTRLWMSTPGAGGFASVPFSACEPATGGRVMATEQVARGGLVLVAWATALAGVLTALHRFGAGVMAAPAVADPGAWATWASAREPLEVVAAVGRLVTIGLGWYLLLVTLIGAVLRLARAVRLVRIADALTVPFVRELLRRGLGVGLAVAIAGSSLQPSPAAADDPVRTPPILLQLDPELPADPAGTPPVLLELDPERRADPVGTPPLLELDRAGPNPVGREVHEVRSGESFWSIAEQMLASVWGRAPSDAEVVPYWRELIAMNRDRLVDPDDPDLIHPGQRFVLPAPPAPR